MEFENINISLSFSQLEELVKQPSPKDKLKLSDLLWSEDISIPVEHQNIVLNRIEKSQKESNRLIDWEVVSKQI